MIKVIIADDEDRVCKLILALIDWKLLDMEICAVAHNGLEALDMIEIFKPDLIITDIKMPGCSGLEMIKQAKQIKSDLSFIVISGYSEFEYAQCSIKHGVEDYLLKPIKKEELTNALIKIRQRFLQKSQQLNNVELLKQSIKDDIFRFRRLFFVEVILPQSYSVDMSIEKLNSLYHLQLKPGLFQAFAVKIDFDFNEQTDTTIKLVSDKILDLINEYFKDLCFESVTYQRDSCIYCIMNYSSGNAEFLQGTIKRCMNDLFIHKGIFENMDFTTGVGQPYNYPEGLRVSFAQAKMCMQQRLIDGVNQIITTLPENDDISIKDIISKFSKDSHKAIEFYDADAAEIVIDKLHEDLLHVCKTGDRLYKTVLETMNLFLMSMNTNQMIEIDANNIYDEFYKKTSVCRSTTEIFNIFKETISHYIKEAIEERKKANILPISIAKRYISENYMHPITLEEVSNLVGFNASYFSSLFKKVCGEGFLDCISEVRINKAKELLKETNLKVSDVCSKVGYVDFKHFAKTFKKRTGLSPNEFRKLYS